MSTAAVAITTAPPKSSPSAPLSMHDVFAADVAMEAEFQVIMKKNAA